MHEMTCQACRTPIPATSRFCRQCGAAVDRATDPQPREYQVDSRVKVIAFDEMSAADNILIQTEHSTYRFSVIDPSERRGQLSGGAFSNGFCDATFVGTIVDSSGFTYDTTGLRTAARALFYIDAGNGFKRLTTSVITDLTIIRGAPCEMRTTLF